METTRNLLLRALAHRQFHTGTELGARVGLSRAAVHKHVRALVEQGVPTHSVPGRGYRLADGVSLLDAAAIRQCLSPEAGALDPRIEVLDEVDSTSAELARGNDAASAGMRVCLAEKQTAGRGRRGRTWVAEPYRDLMMSMAVSYRQWPAELPTLGLVTAMQVVDALSALGVPGLGVKWPNDVVHARGKVCGVLLDVTGEAHGACRVIIGIGINVSTGEDRTREIARQWTDLSALAGRTLDRNDIAGRCLDRLLPAYDRFPAAGFSPYRSAWTNHDRLCGRQVSVDCADGSTFQGEAAGVDESGRLVVLGADGARHCFTQGDVSVRRQ
ncbi:MAG TPA: biotin--[acetyl-CoA-carboxylase] ligase [Arenicellales bacterium]|nr:biotin--[acetyl-CoA-carboxylase] ligase [Arenicellales bacterium]